MNTIVKTEEDEPFYAGQTRILEMVASGAALPDTLESIVRLLEAQADGMICSILLLAANGKNVQHGAAPSLPEVYVKAVDGAPIGPRNGSCGTAMFLKVPVVVTDVMTDPRWADYRPLAEISGFRSCWSTPILSAHGDILGSFAMYGREIRGPNADEKRLIAIATHITGIAIERKRAEEAVRKREARISLAAESGDLAFWSLYPGQNTAWMNEQGRRIYGFDPNLPLTRESLLSRVHPEDGAAVKAVLDQACLSYGAFESEHRLVSPFGKTRSVIMRGRCLQDDKGELEEIVGVTIDVSAQKQSEMQLQVQREELAHLNRVALMGEMTASVAHELNQPLTALTNNAAAALRFLDRGVIDPAVLREIFQDMIADSRRAREVIRGIRALARKDKSVRGLLDLNAVIADTLRLLGKDIEMRESTVRLDLDDALPHIEAAPVQIQQVLLNLIINALDALESLPAAARRMIISTHSDNDEVAEVRIRDFGMGLPVDGAEKVFDHFFTTKQDGMGMGLTIVRSIIETHGGMIGAENPPGGGALFFFRLPAVSQNGNNNNEPPERRPELIRDENSPAARRFLSSQPAAHGV